MQARRQVRIRKLEDKHLHRRLKRARLEASLLAQQVQASKDRLLAAQAGLEPQAPLLVQHETRSVSSRSTPVHDPIERKAGSSRQF